MLSRCAGPIYGLGQCISASRTRNIRNLQVNARRPPFHKNSSRCRTTWSWAGNCIGCTARASSPATHVPPTNGMIRETQGTPVICPGSQIPEGFATTELYSWGRGQFQAAAGDLCTPLWCSMACQRQLWLETHRILADYYRVQSTCGSCTIAT